MGRAPGRGHKESDTTEQHTHTHAHAHTCLTGLLEGLNEPIVYTKQFESCRDTGKTVGSSGLLQEFGAVIARCKNRQCMSHSKSSPRLVIIISPPPPLLIKETTRLLWWLSGKESACQSKRHGFDPWSRKIPHSKQQLSPHATTAEPVLLSPGAQLLSPRAQAQALQREAITVRSPSAAGVAPGRHNRTKGLAATTTRHKGNKTGFF